MCGFSAGHACEIPAPLPLSGPSAHHLKLMSKDIIRLMLLCLSIAFVAMFGALVTAATGIQ